MMLVPLLDVTGVPGGEGDTYVVVVVVELYDDELELNE
jgi:hypothetical protein